MGVIRRRNQSADAPNAVAREVRVFHLVINASAIGAVAMHLLDYRRLASTPWLLGEVTLLLLAATSLAWLPRWLRRCRSVAPAVGFWGLLTWAGAEDSTMFDVVGEPVALACRLEAFSKTQTLPDGGVRSLAILTEALASLLAHELPLQPIEASRVRDFEQHDRVWALDLRQLGLVDSHAEVVAA